MATNDGRYSSDYLEEPEWMRALKDQGITFGEMDPSQAAAPKPANAADSYSWNADNVFSSWDLNPLAQQVGGGADGVRDTLASKRDAYLQPYMQQYRNAVGVGSGRAAADDAGLFNDAGFQSYVKSGQLPGAAPGSVSSQWTNGGQSAAAQANQQRNDDLYNTLKQRASQALTIDPNDPNIRQQTDAYRAEQDRSARNYVADLAEGSSSNANLLGERRLASERAGQATGSLKASLIGQELTARRAEIAQALSGMQGVLTQDQTLEMQKELAAIDANLRSRGLDITQQGQTLDWKKAQLNDDQFYAQLGLNAEDRSSYWDAIRRGLL